MEPKTIKFLSIIATALLFSSCYYDVEEEIYPTLDCQSSDMSYANDIQPLIQTNCYVCHAANINFGNITLDSYPDLLVRVEDGRLLGAINHQSGFSPMPQNGPKLLDCQIEKIESWIADGAPNN
jgi:mono/diheme cytochrome c family protein